MKIIHLVFFMLTLKLLGQNYSSSWYTTDNGLQQNSIKDITQDKYGYIWVSTEHGILRYDGNSFLSFNNFTLNNLHFTEFKGNIEKDSIIIWNDLEKECLLIKERKIYPIGKNNSYKSKININGESYEQYIKRNIPHLTPNKSYTIQLKESRYLFTDNLIIYKDNRDHKEVKIYTDFSTHNMKNVFVHGETIFIPDVHNQIVKKITKGIVSSEKNSLYTNTETKIYWEKINNQVFLINNNDIYISTYEKLLSPKKLLNYPKFGNYNFYSMFYDSIYKTLYLGSLTKGLNILKLYDFSTVKRNIPFKDDSFDTSLVFDTDKVITPEGYLFNKNSLIKDYSFNRINSKNSILYDDTHNIVCFNIDGIEKYYKKDNYKRKEVIKSNFLINNIFKIKGNYFSESPVNGKSVLLLYNDDQFNSVKHVFTFNSRVNCILPYVGNTFLIGCQEGLYLLNLTDNTVKKIKTPKICIKNICKTRDGNIWILSNSSGTYFLKNQVLIKVPYENNALSSPHDILEDKSGFLWISTNNGLFKVSKNSILLNINNPRLPLNYYRFTTLNGFGSNEFNGAGKPIGNVLKNGTFVFPSLDGLVFFTPEKVSTFYPKIIHIERVNLNDQGVKSCKDTLYFENNFSKAEFYIDTPYYSNKENLHIEARILGSEWVRVGENRRYIFSKAEPGEYTLQIRALIDSKDNYYYKNITIFIAPLFYQTAWFKISVIILLILVVLFVIRKRTKKLKEIVIDQHEKIKNVEENLQITKKELKNETYNQEELFQSITHDIATPIKHFANISQLLLETNDSNLQKKYFESLYKSSEQLYALIVSFKEYRDAFNDENLEDDEYFLYDIVQNKIGLFKDIAQHNKTKIFNKINRDTKLTINKNVLSIVIQNIFDNAIKNTLSGSITFDFYKDAEFSVIVISDTGSGMTSNELEYYNNLYKSSKEPEKKVTNFGLGLHLVIRLIKKINSKIEFLNNDTKGTIVKIKLKNYV